MGALTPELTACRNCYEAFDTSRFEINKRIEYKLLITVVPDGYLKRVR